MARARTAAASMLLSCVFTVASAATAPTSPAEPGAAPGVEFPQRRVVEGYALTLHAPQVRSWPGFERFTASIAFELTPPGASTPRLGTATVAGDTAVDLTTRIVTVTGPKVTDVKFADAVPAEYTQTVQNAVVRKSLEVPVDIFLAHVADEVFEGPPPAGFNTAPPPIVVRSTPTMLLFVNGAPVHAPVPNTSLEVLVNANWPVFRDPSGPAWYLLERDRWFTSRQLEQGWKVATSLPAVFASLPASPEYEAARKAVPLQKSTRPVPQLVYADRPTELIVTDGKPALEAVPGAAGLQWVRNTESPLFKLGTDWYFLVAGRWFTTASLEKGPWTFVKDLPEAFSAIPEDHPRAAVRASVPGTIEARMAALEASLPTKTKVKKGSPPTVEVTYAGEPKFEPIPGVPVARAVNTGYDVLMYGNRYYLCYSAAWYVSDSPTGPWGATADVPAAIYSIPPNSPAYAVTDVKPTAASDGDEIEYSSTGAYAAGMFVAFGIAYYGTGWYYPPYAWGPYYYPYWGSYGHGSWYNPATGRYGSRSVWYGPYGGYSYTQGYNPRTGRYGYVETAWDGDEWGSYGQTYNPRTGIGTETERHYNEDKNTLKTERTIERGDQSIKTDKKVDFDEGTRTVERTGSGGESMTSTTKREDGRSATAIEGSGGGQAISVSGEGPGRTTIGQSASGDLYAGHDGNVYKKTEDGWQHYENGNWTPAEPSGGGNYRQMGSQVAPPEGAATRQPSAGTTARQPTAGSMQSQPRSTRSSSQLDRDYAARQRGTQQFQQRGGMSRGAGMGRRR